MNFIHIRALIMALVYKRTSTDIDECIKDSKKIMEKILEEAGKF